MATQKCLVAGSKNFPLHIFMIKNIFLVVLPSGLDPCPLFWEGVRDSNRIWESLSTNFRVFFVSGGMWGRSCHGRTLERMSFLVADLKKRSQPKILENYITWNPNMEVWNVMFFFSWVICRFHVNFQGYTCHQHSLAEGSRTRFQ